MKYCRDRFMMYYHVYTDTAMRIEHVAKFNAYVLELAQELESQELVTNSEPDALTALTQYRKRDRVEKQFDTLKHMLDGKSLRTQGIIANESIVFIRFLSLIITEHIRKILRETPIHPEKENTKNWMSRYSVAEVFNRLESYTEVSFKHTYKPIYPEKTKAQRDIFAIFGIETT